MKWIAGKGNRSSAVKKYKSGHYYFTNTTPWYEIFVERKWTGKKYLNEWIVKLVKDKHTYLSKIKIKKFTDIPKTVNVLKNYAEMYHKGRK